METTRKRADTDSDHTLRSRLYPGARGAAAQNACGKTRGVFAMKFGSMPVRHQPHRGTGQSRGHAESAPPVTVVTADPARPSANAIRVNPGGSRTMKGGTA